MAIFQLDSGSINNLTVAGALNATASYAVTASYAANAGGVTVSYFEWVQNRYGHYWSEEEVNAKHDKNMILAFENVLFNSQQYKTSMRAGAYITALKKIGKAIEYRGKF